MTERPPLRTVRAGVFTSVCASVSVGGHSLSSGHGVPLGGLIVGSALVYAVAWAVTGRERGLGAIAGWMAWSQSALHLVYTTAQSAGGHHGSYDEALAAASGSGGMLAVHAAAGAVCAWWLRQGEAALFAYLRLVAVALLPLLALATVSPSPPRPRTTGSAAPPRGRETVLYLRHSLVLRGPPAFC
ncbi:hypothetical protein KIK06_15920 [Nocardiopsis sp. EMB25]|uniref:hypothetical protein n=1 Tax=Nocardiopsis sp. EMB25 TaxID=2835867 RepID=UPI002284D3F4|nr:hypothetical protein [Nocardiopsis sp. EMB25]MCY9785372.1 hypothetical protein [Nocardiopsis sp. EMB25]